MQKMRVKLTANYVLRLCFATAFLVSASYFFLLVLQTIDEQGSKQQQFQGGFLRAEEKWKYRPPDGIHLIGLERLIKPGEDGEGVDFDAVLKELREEREKFARHPPSESKAKDDDANLAQQTDDTSQESTSTADVKSDGNSSNSTKYILYWNEAYGSRRYGFCCGRQPFLDFDCPVSDCHVTDDRALLGGDVARFDAVLFHLREMSKKDLPERRTPSQRYVMFMLESAQYMMGHDSREWNDFFNWTLTYRLDSDFPMPYGRFVKVKDHPEDPHELDRLVKAFGKANKGMLRGKKDRAAWFVSNCESMSQREKYVEALSKHFPVDVYGACGNLTCDKRHTEECWAMVDRDYKFYLAFENSVCVDYATEKFFNAVSKARSVLPIVMGGADYSALGAPPGSYLSVHESEEWERHPASLAKELRRLSGDAAALAERFWWRDYYDVSQGKANLAGAFCDLCAALHDGRAARRSEYPDLEEWWERRAHCRRMRRTYR